MKNLITILLVFLFVSCTNKEDFEKGKHQLEQQGYTDIEFTGYSNWCCGEDDSYRSGFKCKDKHGNTVSGCFCSSWGKGVTIRFK